VTTPQLIFLGLDERVNKEQEGEGFVWKEVYKGAPMFAVDVTPKGSIKEECEKLIKEVTDDKKLEFLEGSRNMILSFPAQDGCVILTKQLACPCTDTFNYSCNIRPSPRPPRLERTQPFLRKLRTTHPLHQRRRQTHLSPDRPRPCKINGRSRFYNRLRTQQRSRTVHHAQRRP